MVVVEKMTLVLKTHMSVGYSERRIQMNSDAVTYSGQLMYPVENNDQQIISFKSHKNPCFVDIVLRTKRRGS